MVFHSLSLISYPLSDEFIKQKKRLGYKTEGPYGAFSSCFLCFSAVSIKVIKIITGPHFVMILAVALPTEHSIMSETNVEFMRKLPIERVHCES